MQPIVSGRVAPIDKTPLPEVAGGWDPTQAHESNLVGAVRC